MTLRMKSPGGPYIHPPEPLTIPDHHWAKVLKDPDGCWRWTAYRDRRGYGHARIGAKVYPAHRLFYIALVGPTNLTIDHICRNPSCVNPEHLEAVTHAENVRRGNAGKWNRDKTHCPRGHAYEGDNLVRYASGRQCRQCNRDRYTISRPRLCESTDPSCRAEVWLNWKDYKAATSEGRVVCSACVPNRATVIRFLNAGSAAVIAL